MASAGRTSTPDTTPMRRPTSWPKPARRVHAFVPTSRHGTRFCGEIVDYGPKSERKLAVGTSVVAVPLVRQGKDIHAIGLSASAPGAYAEQVVVEESLTFALPNGLSSDIGVLTEPMAVGYHAVRRAEVDKKDVAIVIGCGPVGLAVIAMLKAKASAPSWPAISHPVGVISPDRAAPTSRRPEQGSPYEHSVTAASSRQCPMPPGGQS